MDQKQAIDILNQWIVLLDEIISIKVDCDSPPDTIVEDVQRRQRVIDRIQQLDASLMAVREFRFGNSPDLDAQTLDGLMETGKALSADIIQTSQKTIEIANKGRSNILDRLRNNTLSKGYLSSNQAPKIRPPAIVDGNA